MNDKGRAPRKGLDETLREALHSAPDGFDYDALVEGVHQRAGRIRRRRTVGTLAAAAVLLPGLVGGGVLVTNLIEEQAGQVSPAPAGPSDGSDQGDGSGTTEEPTAEEPTAEEPTAEEPTTPPWQEGEPPAADDVDDDNADNAWEIPDPRPTGVAYLDDLGAPKTSMEYQSTSPVMGAMTCDREDIAEDAMESVATTHWTYFPDSGNSPAVDITVSGWEDGVGAMDGLRADELFCAWDLNEDNESVQAEATWPDHEGEEAYYLNETYPGYGFLSDASVSVAVVRTGDYLVAVRVQDLDPEVAQEASTEIADKAAENLAALDPEHGRD